ncbi:3376_t:CDS:1, partial [Paraglomus occultum]
GMAISIPNSTMFHHKIYALRKVNEIQDQQHIAQMIYQLNHHNFYNSTLKIRLQQIQNAAATNTSILTNHSYTLSQEEHFSTTAKMLQSLHQAKVSIKHADIWPKPLTFQGTTINYILQQLKSAYKIKTKLNKLEIYAIEQCTNYTHSQTLIWTHIAQTIPKIQRGRKPKWFEQITQQTNKIIGDENYKLLTPNPYTLKAKQINKKDWVYNTKTK